MTIIAGYHSTPEGRAAVRRAGELLGFIQEEGNSAAAYLVRLNQQYAQLKTEYDLLSLLDLDQTHVSFRWKDYRAKGKTRHKTMTLGADEFIRRFLLHVLPGRFHRIRHYGLLANGNRKHNLALARELLHPPTATQAQATDNTAHSEPASRQPSFVCMRCGRPMMILQTFVREQSIRDPLTGLYNRRYMEEALKQHLSHVTRHLHPLGVMMIDIDHFKGFNDRYGHRAGDGLLRELGKFLQNHIRAEDIACRYGGEEFLLIMPDTLQETALRRAEQLRQEVRTLRVENAGQPHEEITLSLGVAIYPVHGHTIETLLRAADSALYRAKQEGRDRVIVDIGHRDVHRGRVDVTGVAAAVIADGVGEAIGAEVVGRRCVSDTTCRKRDRAMRALRDRDDRQTRI